MIQTLRWTFAAAVLLVGMSGVRAGDVPPPSPYGLPAPGLQTDPDEEEPIRPWRHWGDSRNSGEFVKSLIAPGLVEPSPPLFDSRRLHFCRRHPDQCADQD